MASLIQEIFKISNISSLSNNSAAGSSTSAGPGSSEKSLLAICYLLFSSSALGDWLKLIVIGGLFETIRRFATTSYSNFLSSFRVEAVFDEEDDTYEWIMVWLSKQPSWADVRSVEVTSGDHLNDSHCVVLEDEGTSKYDGRVARKVMYYPSPSRSYTMWYKRRYMTVTRVQDSGRWGKENSIRISIMTRNGGLLKEMLQEARREFVASKDKKLSIYTSDLNNSWRMIGSRPKRSLQSIVLDGGVKDMLLDDAQDFLASREWYSERGIPFRRGYLLYGAPGCGKTSLIHSIAGELDLDVYIVSLSRAGLDDNALSQLINDLPEKSIALMEDVDAAFVHGLNREPEQDTRQISKAEDEDAPAQGPSPAMTTGSKLSLSGLLNCLDGIGAAEGRILFATTNKYSSLDPALTRPGRMDVHIEFKLASKHQARELFWRFYKPIKNMDGSEPLPEQSNGSHEKISDVSATETGQRVQGTMHHHSTFSDASIKALASQFAELVPERQLSMAALQGFLMNYKTRPSVAVEKASGWLEEELARRSRAKRLTSPTVEDTKS